MSAKQILIREVPEETYDWIERERHARRVSQKAFLLSVLNHGQHNRTRMMDRPIRHLLER